MPEQGVTTHRTIARTTAQEWDRLVGGPEFHLSRAWLASVETGRGDAVRYLHHRDGTGVLRGSAVAYLTEDSAASNRDSLNRLTRVDHLLRSALEPAPTGRTEPADIQDLLGRTLPSLACGGWTLVNSALSLDPAIDPADRREVANALLTALRAEAEAAGARSLNFPYVDEHNPELRELLLEHGFLEFPVSAHSALDVVWDSFDGYLEHLAYNRRRAVKRELAKLAEAGVVYRTVPLTPELVERLLPLGVATVQRHQGFVAADQIESRLRMLAGFGCHVILAEQEGALCGFGVVAPWKDQLYARMVGFDYDLQRNLPVYFGIMYEQIRFAVAHGLRRIEYATTTERAKASRGAVSIAQYGYLQVFDPADAERLAVLLASAGDDCGASPEAPQ